jgi:hypothetical protein
MQNAAAAACLVLLAACSLPRLDVTPRFGTFDIEGSAGISESGTVAKADLETAGLEKDDSVFGVRADFDWGPSHVMVSGQQTTHDGDGTLEATFTSGGVTIPAGAEVASELDLGLYTGAFTFDFIPTDLVEVGVGLGVSYVDVDASFQEEGTGETIETDEQIPVPVLAARLGTRIWRLDASLQASGLKWSYDGNDIYLVDLDLLAKLRLFGGDEHLAGHLTAGYRWVDLELDYEDGDDSVETDATFQGPYIGLTLSI